ncbi:MAG: response regulator [Promethearchaeota archaeon]
MFLKIFEIEKTEDMERYETETGKKARWHGKITEGFKKWQKGKKMYGQKKSTEKVVTYIKSDIKSKWIIFAQENEYSSISNLVRNAVNILIKITSLLKNYGEKSDYESISNLIYDSIKFFYQKEKFSDSEIFHDLKEPLSIIKGFSNLILEDFPQLKEHRYFQELYKSCLGLEEKIQYYFELSIVKFHKYDVLLIDDDIGTTKLVSEYFNKAKYSIKSVFNARDALKELNRNVPKLILLDIFLPDMTGYEFCKKLKSNVKFKNIPIVYLTAIPKKEAEEKIKDSGGEGLILKPFDFDDFKNVSKFLK